MAGITEYDESRELEVVYTKIQAKELFEELRKILLYKNDEWIALAFKLLMGQLINNYRSLEERIENRKGSQKDLVFPYKIGELLIEFVKRRQKDTKKSELVENPKLNINRNKIIHYLADFMDANEKEKGYGSRYYRYCCQFYENYDLY